MRPSTYEKEIVSFSHKIPRTEIGFVTDPTLKDFYNVLSQVRDQKIYPDLKTEFVNIVTRDMTVTDVNNLRGISETKYGNLPVKRYDSIVYFESIDQKCVGTIDVGTKSEESIVTALSLLIGGGELFSSMLAMLMSILKPTLIPIGITLGYDGSRRVNNYLNNDVLKVKVGSSQDIQSPIVHSSEKYFRSVRRYLEKMIEDIEGIDDVRKNEEKEYISLLEGIMGVQSRPTYSVIDLENFRNFVNHIRQIKL